MEHDSNEETLRILAPEGHPLTRRGFMSLAAMASAAALTAGPELAASAATMSQLESAARKSMKSIGKAKSLYLYTWGQYDNPTTFTAWAKGAGFTIQVGSYNSNPALIAKLELAKGTAGYDIVVPTGGYVPEMVAKGLLIPLDRSKLPNFKNLDPALLNYPWDRGNKYTIPKDFGTTGYIYDTSIVTRKMTTWLDFVKAAAMPAVSGRVSVLDDPDDVLGIALWNEGVDWNTFSTAKLQARPSTGSSRTWRRTSATWTRIPVLRAASPAARTFSRRPGTATLARRCSRIPSDSSGSSPTRSRRSGSTRGPSPKAPRTSTPPTLSSTTSWTPTCRPTRWSTRATTRPSRTCSDYLPKILPRSDVIFLTPEQEKRLVAYQVNSTINLRTQLYDQLQSRHRLVAAPAMPRGA